MIQNILLHLPLQPQEDAGLWSCVCHISQSHRDIWGTLGHQNNTICLNYMGNWILSTSIILVYCFVFYCLWKLTWVYMHSWKEVLSEILHSSSIPLIFLKKLKYIWWLLIIIPFESSPFHVDFHRNVYISQKWISNEDKLCHSGIQ